MTRSFSGTANNDRGVASLSLRRVGSNRVQSYWESWNMYGGGRNDTLIGGAKNDYLGGDKYSNGYFSRIQGDDVLEGRGGNDRIFGHGGNDTLRGGTGNDTLEGGAGNDFVYGGANNDTVIVKNFTGNDKFYGGTGQDTIFFNPSDGRDLDINLATNTVSDNKIGSQLFYEFEIVKSGRGNDKLRGDNRDNLLFGGAGNDTIIGGGGRDALIGSAGDDILMGATSRSDTSVDRLTGGSGNDDFRLGGYHGNLYSTAGNNDYAVITDMEAGDRITLDGRILSGGSYNYRLAESPVAGIRGTGVFDGSELIAIVQGVSSQQLAFKGIGSAMATLEWNSTASSLTSSSSIFVPNAN